MDQVTKKKLEDVFFNSFFGGYKCRPYNFIETNGYFELKLEMPGVSKEDLNVYFEKNKLIVEHKFNENKKLDADVKYHSYQLDYNKSVSFEISNIEEILVNDVSCKLENGILAVNIPKNLNYRKKIEIK